MPGLNRPVEVKQALVASQKTVNTGSRLPFEAQATNNTSRTGCRLNAATCPQSACLAFVSSRLGTPVAWPPGLSPLPVSWFL